MTLSLVTADCTANMDSTGVDKVIHVFMYTVFTFVNIVGFRKQYTFLQLRYRAIPFALAISSSYGVLMEIMQTLNPSRGADIVDVGANLIGVGIGYSLYYLVYEVKYKSI